MPRPASILAAITPAELAGFLPGSLESELCGITQRFAHVDTTGLNEEAFRQHLADADPEVLVACWSTPALPEKLPPSLRYVAYLAGTIRQLATRKHIEDGLLVTNWGGSVGRFVAEGALLHILSCLRYSAHWTRLMHLDGGWKDSHRPDTSLYERRVGIHGFGQVAKGLVRLLQPFGCRVSAFAPDIDARVEAEHGITRARSLEELFSGNEIVVELAPLTSETRGVIDERLLRLIPEGGVFVNTGRGAVVDEDALARVARDGRIAIGLDVYDVEPLPVDSPLRGLRNVFLTPHVAGPTPDRFRDAGEFLVRNVRAYAEGRPLQGLYTPGIYDQST